MVLAAALVLATAGGCNKRHAPAPAPTGKAFDRACLARGGHPTTQRTGHGIVRVCLPPAGGWN
jgi:hypothetical protein